MDNDPGSSKLSRWPWSRVFGLVCWTISKNRCKKAFEGVADSLKCVVHKCTFQLLEGVENGHFKLQMIPDRAQCRWTLPSIGFVRIDVDGSIINQNHATGGGVVRDEQGTWLMGFQQYFGYGTSTTVELLAIRAGL